MGHCKLNTSSQNGPCPPAPALHLHLRLPFCHFTCTCTCACPSATSPAPTPALHLPCTCTSPAPALHLHFTCTCPPAPATQKISARVQQQRACVRACRRVGGPCTCTLPVHVHVRAHNPVAELPVQLCRCKIGVYTHLINNGTSKHDDGRM